MSVSQAVFISYAREDIVAAQSIAETLKQHGVEVWFDRSELIGGDAWDGKIRRQIKECSLFIAVISRQTDARLEGYFRREWKMAIDRSHDMAEERAFLLPVTIDDTTDLTSLVPEKFREVQWIHLPDGLGNETLAHRVQALLVGTASGGTNAPYAARRAAADAASSERGRGAAKKTHASKGRLALLAGLLALTVVVALIRFWPKAPKPAAVAAAPLVPTPVVVAPAPAGNAAQKEGRPRLPPVARLTEARQLSAKAALLWEKWDDATTADWALADDLCKRAVELDPSDGEAWAVYAQVASGEFEFYHTPGADDLARTRAERAVRLQPTSKTARLALANAYRTNAATLPESERMLRELLTSAPKDKRVLRTLGEALSDLKRDKEALTYFNQAAAMAGGDPLALLAKSFTLERLGRYAEAESVIEQALVLRVGPAALLRKMECQLSFRGDLTEAAETLTKVPASSLLDDRAISLACQLWLWSHQPDKCLGVLSAASRDFLHGFYWSGVPKGWLMGRVHQLGGRPAVAESHWRTTLKTIGKTREEDPDDVGLIVWSAHVHASLGEKEEAEKMLGLAQQLAGVTAEKISSNVAAIWVLLGKHAEILPLLEAKLKTAEGPTLRVELRLDPAFDALRGNPRFEAMLAEPKRRVPR